MHTHPNYCSTGWVHYYKVEEMFSNFEKFLESGADDSAEMLTAEQAWKEASQTAEEHFRSCGQCSAEESRLLAPIVSRLVRRESRNTGQVN